MREWIATGQPMPVGHPSGHSDDSPGNSPVARKPGQIASGHPVTDAPPGGDPHDPGRVDRHLWQQPAELRPRPLAVVQSCYGEQNPLGSSIAEHQGRASLGMLDYREAANPTLTSQLAAPATGNPEMAAGSAREAPSGHGQAPGVTPRRTPGQAYMPYDRDGNAAPKIMARALRQAPGA
jgi:hypothetical protein